MRVAILAGGVGRRLAEETRYRPKALVEIGHIPILWHLISIFGSQDFDTFTIALGHRGDQIREYFGAPESTDGTSSVACSCGWKVQLLETGLDTATGGRIKRVASLLGNAPFVVANVDGLFDIDISALTRFHCSHGRLVTVVAVHPPPRFGQLDLDADCVVRFSEKRLSRSQWINGGIYVLSPGVEEYIHGDATEWEREPLESLAADGQLMAFRHTGFWQCMDTIHERDLLEDMWQTGEVPWNRPTGVLTCASL